MTAFGLPLAGLARLLVALLALVATAPHALGAGTDTADGPLPSPYAIDIPKWFTETLLDLRDDVADAARENRRVLLYFGQDGCPYCTALMKVNFSQPDIVATTRGNFVAIALNIWGDRDVTWTDGRAMSEKELARALAVQFTPTLLFLDEKGGIALRLNGYQPPDRFRVALDYVRLHRESQGTFTAYLAAHPSPPSGVQRRLAPQQGGARRHDPSPTGRGAGVREVRVDLQRALHRSGKPLLVLFEQADCRACDELHAEGLSRADAKALLARFRVVKLDFLGRREIVTPAGKRMRESEWARALNIVYTPSLVFFDRAGGEVFRADGYLRPFHLASSLDYVASGAYRREPNFQRFIKVRAEARRGKGTPVDLWE